MGGRRRIGRRQTSERQENKPKYSRLMRHMVSVTRLHRTTALATGRWNVTAGRAEVKRRIRDCGFNRASDDCRSSNTNRLLVQNRTESLPVGIESLQFGGGLVTGDRYAR